MASHVLQKLIGHSHNQGTYISEEFTVCVRSLLYTACCFVTWTKNLTVTTDFTKQHTSLVSASPVVEHGSMLTTLCLCIDQNLLDSWLPYGAWVDINRRDIHCNDVSSSSTASAISQDGFITLLLKNAAHSPGYKTACS